MYLGFNIPTALIRDLYPTPVAPPNPLQNAIPISRKPLSERVNEPKKLYPDSPLKLAPQSILPSTLPLVTSHKVECEAVQRIKRTFEEPLDEPKRQCTDSHFIAPITSFPPSPNATIFEFYYIPLTKPSPPSPMKTFLDVDSRAVQGIKRPSEEPLVTPKRLNPEPLKQVRVKLSKLCTLEEIWKLEVLLRKNDIKNLTYFLDDLVEENSPEILELYIKCLRIFLKESVSYVHNCIYFLNNDLLSLRSIIEEEREKLDFSVAEVLRKGHNYQRLHYKAFLHLCDDLHNYPTTSIFKNLEGDALKLARVCILGMLGGGFHSDLVSPLVSLGLTYTSTQIDYFFKKTGLLNSNLRNELLKFICLIPRERNYWIDRFINNTLNFSAYDCNIAESINRYHFTTEYLLQPTIAPAVESKDNIKDSYFSVLPRDIMDLFIVPYCGTHSSLSKAYQTNIILRAAPNLISHSMVRSSGDVFFDIFKPNLSMDNILKSLTAQQKDTVTTLALRLATEKEDFVTEETQVTLLKSFPNLKTLTVANVESWGLMVIAKLFSTRVSNKKIVNLSLFFNSVSAKRKNPGIARIRKLAQSTLINQLYTLTILDPAFDYKDLLSIATKKGLPTKLRQITTSSPISDKEEAELKVYGGIPASCEFVHNPF